MEICLKRDDHVLNGLAVSVNHRSSLNSNQKNLNFVSRVCRHHVRFHKLRFTWKIVQTKRSEIKGLSNKKLQSSHQRSNMNVHGRLVMRTLAGQTNLLPKKLANIITCVTNSSNSINNIRLRISCNLSNRRVHNESLICALA